MNKLLFSCLILCGTLSAEEYEIEESEGTEEATDVCIPDEVCEAPVRRRCRRPPRCYIDRDRDAVWPGKTENSFINEIQR